MTRFARAKGSKASNERVVEEATSWSEMKRQLDQKLQEVEMESNRKEFVEKRRENYDNFLKQVEAEQKPEPSWADFPEHSITQQKVKRDKVQKQPQVELAAVREDAAQSVKGGLKKKRAKGQKKGDVNGEFEVVEWDSSNLSGKEVAVQSQKSGPKKKGKKNKSEIVQIVGESENIEVSDKEGSAQNKKRKMKKKRAKVQNPDGEEETVCTNGAENQDHTKSAINAVDNTPKKSKNKKSGKKRKAVEEDEKIPENNGENTISENVNNSAKKKRKKSQDQNQSENTPNKSKKSKLAQTKNKASSTAAEKPKKTLDEMSEAERKLFEKKKQKKLKQLEKRKLSKEQQNETKSNNKTPQPKKTKPDKTKTRRKPDSQIEKLHINGKDVELTYIEGFPVKKEDGERIKQLRKQMISKGLPRSEINAALKLERRRAEKALSREKKNVCFNCRKSGHNLSECPELAENSERAVSGICFKCGSTEHTHFECKVVRNQEFRFATCFICKEQGHISRQCPDNARGLYPKGGGCKVCGDVTHMKRDCPKFVEEQAANSVALETIGAGFNVEGLDSASGQSRPVTKHVNKVIKF